MKRWHVFTPIAVAVALFSTLALSQYGGGYRGRGGEPGFTVESSPGTAPSAVGTDAIAIGDGAVAGDAAADENAIAIGTLSTATGLDSIAIGDNTDATGAGSIAIGGNSVDGNSADATGAASIAIGENSLADTDKTVAVGAGARATGDRSIGLGAQSDASGANSIALGGSSAATTGPEASATDSIAIGRSTVASATNCIAIGGNVDDTSGAKCSAVDAVALGHNIIADDIGQYIFGSGEFAAQSDASRSFYILRNSTTDATQTELFADGSAGDIAVPSDCTIVFDLLLVARQTDADDVEAGYKIEGVIGNNAGTTALVGTIGKTVLAEDVAAWDVTATADDTNDGLNVLVTGAASTAAQWVAYVNTVKTCG